MARCPQCDGNGTVIADTAQVVCGMCRGSGRVSDSEAKNYERQRKRVRRVAMIFIFLAIIGMAFLMLAR
jgi:DnaJ-class molecular chaperone